MLFSDIVLVTDGSEIAPVVGATSYAWHDVVRFSGALSTVWPLALPPSCTQH